MHAPNTLYGRLQSTGQFPIVPHRTAGVCAFSLTSRITQRDGTTGRDAPAAAPSCTPATRDRTGRLHRDVHGRPAACRNPGLPDDPGLASASRPPIARGPQAPGRQPGHPGARSPSPAASGRPGRAPVHPLRRDPRSAPPPGGRSPSGMHLRTEVPVPWRPGRPCRRQMSTFAIRAAMYKYTALVAWPAGL